MKCGAPVLAGNRTSLTEVVGDAGLLVDPFDTNAIASGIARLVESQDFRNDLRAKGLRRSQMFDWEKTARSTLEVYKRAVDNSRAVTHVWKAQR